MSMKLFNPKLYKMPHIYLYEQVRKFDEYYISQGLDPYASHYSKYLRGWLMKADCDYKEKNANNDPESSQ